MAHLYPQQQRQEREDVFQVPTCCGPFKGQKAFAEQNTGKLNLCFATSPNNITVISSLGHSLSIRVVTEVTA